jgi:hypothetical protein
MLLTPLSPSLLRQGWYSRPKKTLANNYPPKARPERVGLSLFAENHKPKTPLRGETPKQTKKNKPPARRDLTLALMCATLEIPNREEPTMADYEDNYTRPTTDQLLMSESCYTCGEPTGSRGQCLDCRLEDLEAQQEALNERRAEGE